MCWLEVKHQRSSSSSVSLLLQSCNGLLASFCLQLTPCCCISHISQPVRSNCITRAALRPQGQTVCQFIACSKHNSPGLRCIAFCQLVRSVCGLLPGASIHRNVTPIAEPPISHMILSIMPGYKTSITLICHSRPLASLECNNTMSGLSVCADAAAWLPSRFLRL